MEASFALAFCFRLLDAFQPSSTRHGPCTIDIDLHRAVSREFIPAAFAVVDHKEFRMPEAAARGRL
jgi:hypothetical protein